MYLKQNAAVDIAFGPFLDSTDGVTPETALTITQPDIRLKKNGGAWAQKNAAQTLSHEEFGWYEVSLDVTDTNTLGILTVAVYEVGALPVWQHYMVLSAQVYDALVTGLTNYLPVDVKKWMGNELTAGANQYTAGFPVVTIKDGAAQGEILTTSGAIDSVTTTATATNVTTVATVTAVSGLTAANLDVAVSTRATPAQVNTEVDTALADVNLDHLVGTATAIPAIPAGTFVDQMMDDGTAVFDRTTDSLQAIGDKTALASVCTSLRLGELDAANLPTDINLISVDTNNIRAKLPLELTTANGLMKVSVEALLDDVAGGVEAATDLRTSAKTIVRGIVQADAGNSNIQMKTDLTPTANDHYKGRVIIFTSTVLADQATSISTYDGSTKIVTFPALTSIPAAGTTFVIV